MTNLRFHFRPEGYSCLSLQSQLFRENRRAKITLLLGPESQMVEVSITPFKPMELQQFITAEYLAKYNM